MRRHIKHPNIRTQVHLHQPGEYALGGWRLEICISQFKVPNFFNHDDEQIYGPYRIIIPYEYEFRGRTRQMDASTKQRIRDTLARYNLRYSEERFMPVRTKQVQPA